MKHTYVVKKRHDETPMTTNRESMKHLGSIREELMNAKNSFNLTQIQENRRISFRDGKNLNQGRRQGFVEIQKLINK